MFSNIVKNKNNIVDDHLYCDLYVLQMHIIATLKFALGDWHLLEKMKIDIEMKTDY